MMALPSMALLQNTFTIDKHKISFTETVARLNSCLLVDLILTF